MNIRKNIKSKYIKVFYLFSIIIALGSLNGCASSIPKCSGESPALKAQEKDYNFDDSPIGELIKTRIK